MPCVNHPGNPVQSYCQNCGKALCASCVRTTPADQVFCESCMAATGGGANVPNPGAAWTPVGFQGNPMPVFSASWKGGPNPSAAAVLGLIPGAGAFYNAQYFKGLIHVIVFAILVSLADRHGIFGLFIAAWVLYQAFEAYHTAKARRDGQPLPDPFGLNEMGSWFTTGGHSRPGAIPPNYQAAAPPNPVSPAYGPGASSEPPIYNAPYNSSWTSPSEPASGPAAGYPSQPPYTETWPGSTPNPDPYAQNYPQNYPPNYPPNYPSGVIPPIPPVPPYFWRRKEPVFAMVLIGLGVIFLLQSMGVVEHLMRFIWPFALIALGAWLFVRRVSDAQGGSK
jgi:hypothetical protein